MSTGPLVLDIKGNSLDDGPGIRTVVFLKGCPLSCAWCHNPESQRPGLEIGWDKKTCIGCGACREECPLKAISPENPGHIDRNLCDLCGKCVDKCPSGALELVGKKMAVADVVAQIVKDKPFFDASGGGATLSGGEPTFFMDYASELLQSLKSMGVRTLVETCGLFSLPDFEKKILPHTDTVYFDLKVMDPGTHKRLCGVDNAKIKKNFLTLFARAKKNGFSLLARTPLVPNMTATDENLSAIAAFLKEAGAGEIHLMAYNPLWHEKMDKIGEQDAYKDTKEMTAWMPREDMARCEKIFTDAGIALV
ncbi:MAG: glycyl-radical enzyme activating protein [Thermodesulfobacteriota bacterium]